MDNLPDSYQPVPLRCCVRAHGATTLEIEHLGTVYHLAKRDVAAAGLSRVPVVTRTNAGTPAELTLRPGATLVRRAEAKRDAAPATPALPVLLEPEALGPLESPGGADLETFLAAFDVPFRELPGTETAPAEKAFAADEFDLNRPLTLLLPSRVLGVTVPPEMQELEERWLSEHGIIRAGGGGGSLTHTWSNSHTTTFSFSFTGFRLDYNADDSLVDGLFVDDSHQDTK
jgi:hypothetical protein